MHSCLCQLMPTSLQCSVILNFAQVQHVHMIYCVKLDSMQMQVSVLAKLSHGCWEGWIKLVEKLWQHNRV